MTSDNDQPSAVEKVVDAFRKRRSGNAPDTATPDTEAAVSGTPVVKIAAGEELVTDTVSADAVTEEKLDEAADDDAALVDDAPADDATVEEAADEAPAENADVDAAAATDDAVDADTAEAEDAADEDAAVAEEAVTENADSSIAITAEEADADTIAMKVVEAGSAADATANAPIAHATEGGVVHHVVVTVPGSGEKATPAPRQAVESVDPDATERPAIVEESVYTSTTAESPADSTPTEQFETPTTQIEVQTAVIETPTAVIDKSAVAKAAAAGAAAAAAAGAGVAAAKTDKIENWSSAPHEPKVIPGAKPADAAKPKRRKLLPILLALLAIALIAALAWFFLVYNSASGKAAKAAQTYQTAMSEGDLATLRDITCGQDNAFYTSVSDAEFAKAVESQRARNQMMSFKDITGVAVDGNVARVGVQVFNTADESQTTDAQVTLHKVDGKWKVCAKP